MRHGRHRVAVVGAGISGLAAAHALLASASDCDLLVLEASDRVGGKLLTDRVDRFVVEGGADSFLASKPDGVALCREVGLAEDLIETNSDRRRTYVLREGHLYRLPEGLSGLVPARLEPLLASPLLSADGKARAAREPDVPPRKDSSDESLADFFRRRFGTETYDRLIEPLAAGVYAGSGENLSVGATFPLLVALEQKHGSVVRGIASQTPGGATRGGFVSLRQGMQSLPLALQQRLPSEALRLGCGVDRMERLRTGFRLTLTSGDHEEVDAAILAVPSYLCAKLLHSVDTDVAHDLDTIQYSSSAIVALAYKSDSIPRPVDGYGYVVPSAEGRPVMAVTWTSAKFAGRAPEGSTLVRVFIGRTSGETALRAPDADLVQIALEEMREITGTVDAPLFSRLYRWPRSMPQFTVGYAQTLDAINIGVRHIPGLELAGHAFGRVGIPDCIASGQAAARRVLEGFNGEPAA